MPIMLFAIVALALFGSEPASAAEATPQSEGDSPAWLDDVQTNAQKARLVISGDNADVNDLLQQLSGLQVDEDKLRGETRGFASRIAELSPIVLMAEQGVDSATRLKSVEECRDHLALVEEISFSLQKLTAQAEIANVPPFQKFADLVAFKSNGRHCIRAIPPSTKNCCADRALVESSIGAYFQDALQRTSSEKDRLARNSSKAAAALRTLKDLREDALNRLRSFDRIEGALNMLPWLFGSFFAFLLLLVLLVSWRRHADHEWIRSGQLTQLLTVSLIVIAVLSLGVARAIKEETLGTLLGGVAAYVLSRETKVVRRGQGNESSPKKES